MVILSIVGSFSAITGIIFGASVLTISGPLLGELFATMAPIFRKKDLKVVSELGIRYEEVEFPTDRGIILRGWYFPSNLPDSPAILYAPATARDQRSGVSLVKPLHEAGYSVLLFSYRGHGESDGNKIGFTYGAEESKDVDAAIKYLNETKGLNQIGAIGHSAGAVSIILSAARNEKIGAVVAASAFQSIEEIWTTNKPKFFPKFLFELTLKLSERRKGFSRNDVRPKDVISKITPRPILLIHGSKDKRITKEQALNLFKKANSPKKLWMIDGVSHSGVRDPGLDHLVREVIVFFDSAFRKTGNPTNLFYISS